MQLTKMPGGFVPGERRRRMAVPGAPAMLPLICYEAIFPGEAVPAGERPGWLLNLTNDAWFGISAGPYQHLQQARVLAIEEGLPLVRTANTGVSAVIDPLGRIVQSLPLGRAGTLNSELPRPIAATNYERRGENRGNNEPQPQVANPRVNRGGNWPRQPGIERSGAPERKRLHDAAQRVDHRRHAGIGGANERKTFLDGEHAGLLQMLVRPCTYAEPRVVGEVQEPARPFSRGHCLTGKDRLVADQRQHLRRAGHRHPPPPLARDEPTRHLGELHQPEAFEERLKRQVFAEGHKVQLIVDRRIEPLWSIT